MKRLAIIGSGDLGQLIAYHAEVDAKYSVVGFFDDYVKTGSIIKGRNILGSISEIENSFRTNDFDVLMIGVGYNHMKFRKELYKRFSKNIPFGSIIHSSSYVDSSVKLGDGIFILPGCILDMNVVLENNVLLNTGVVIAHDTTIMAHSFVSPAVNIAGKTLVKESCILGINSTIIDNIVIEEGIQIGAGAVVIESLLIKGLYIGVPAVLKRTF